MLWEVSGGKSSFKSDIRKDSMEKVGLELALEGKMEFRWKVRKEEVVHKLARCREQGRLCVSCDGLRLKWAGSTGSWRKTLSDQVPL